MRNSETRQSIMQNSIKWTNIRSMAAPEGEDKQMFYTCSIVEVCVVLLRGHDHSLV